MSDDARRGPDRPGEWSNPLEDLIGKLVEGFGDLGAPDGRDSRDDPPPGRPRGDTRTPVLDRFGRDLTAEARAGRLDPVVGREREVAAVLEILGRRTKNNPVLVGDPGVGKTAIVEGIAARIAAGTVPGPSGRRVVAIDLAGLVAGTKYRGEFEERLRRLVDEVTATDRGVVLFLDELHTVVGAGAGVEGTMDAADILKPALARGELQVVGATTLEEYRRHVESDQALERRFAPITVDEPTIEQTVAILDGLKGRYEDHHGVRLPEDTRRAAVELTARHVRDRFLPDKAIDALDTAAARVRLRRAEDPGASGTVSVSDIAQVVADRTGLPVAHLTDSERTRLLGLADHLRRRVVGQDHALDAVTDAVLAGRAGMGAAGTAGGVVPVRGARPGSARPSSPAPWPRPCTAPTSASCASTSASSARPTPSPASPGRRPATSGTTAPASSPRRSAARRRAWCSSTRSRRRIRTCWRCCSGCWTRAG